MPAFTKEELAQIKANTERIEADRARQEKEREAKKKSKKAGEGKGAKTSVGSVKERLVALFLLLLTMGVSYLIMVLV